MNSLWRRPKWPVCAAAAALAACTNSAETNAVAETNAIAEANAVMDADANVDAGAADNMAAEPAPPAVANEATTAAPKAAPPAKAAPETAGARESYAALGQEAGWALKIAGGRIDYTGNYGEKKINVARPDPRPSFNGRRYVTPRLTVDVTYVRCNDAMSGFGFEHQVMVIADGETFKGCGGARKKEWDM
jgi:uncharacterized membrane protein